MKVFKLTSHQSSFFVSSLFDVENFWLVPISNSAEFNSYPKELWKKEEFEAENLETPKVGM